METGYVCAYDQSYRDMATSFFAALRFFARKCLRIRSAMTPAISSSSSMGTTAACLFERREQLRDTAAKTQEISASLTTPKKSMASRSRRAAGGAVGVSVSAAAAQRMQHEQRARSASRSG